jgi:hypothetical protein
MQDKLLEIYADIENLQKVLLAILEESGLRNL